MKTITLILAITFIGCEDSKKSRDHYELINVEHAYSIGYRHGLSTGISAGIRAERTGVYDLKDMFNQLTVDSIKYFNVLCH